MDTLAPPKPILKPDFLLGGYYPTATSVPKLSHDEQRMKVALNLSQKSIGITSPNPAVGCVVYQGERLLAQGSTQEFRQKHAERMALETFDVDSRNCEIYVTLEPCTHQGHQPPCIDLITSKPWKHVFIATRDPNPQVNGRALRALKSVNQPYTLGVLESECRAWNLPFFFYKTRNRPLLVGKWAESLNGYLADPNGKSKWITQKAARKYSHWLRRKYDAILVGAQTFLQDRPLLNCREHGVGPQPLRLIWDPKGRTKDCEWLQDKDFLETNQPTLVLRENNLAQELLSKDFLDRAEGLRSRPLQSIFVEGGSQTLHQLIDALDVIHIFKGSKNIEASAHKSPKDIFEDNSHWKVLSVAQFENDGQQDKDILVEAIRSSNQDLFCGDP